MFVFCNSHSSCFAPSPLVLHRRNARGPLFHSLTTVRPWSSPSTLHNMSITCDTPFSQILSCIKLRNYSMLFAVSTAAMILFSILIFMIQLVNRTLVYWQLFNILALLLFAWSSLACAHVLRS
ncbi:hypothetical protein BKA66DRAFT_469763 [Pyrenochaeta sp. MPI-SDFR-AT-0127]|nr:hypothetical protein BKA66DRAFT_469763 [Pyrenochaeta sp. MPI-SDFR-AT-0127]